MFSAVLLCAVLYACVVLWWRARMKESRAHPLPPSLPHRMPVIGHLHKLMTASTNLWETINFFADATIERGGVTYTNFGPYIHYLVTDAEDALTVANACLKKHFTYRFARYWLGKGLFTGSGEKWHRHRKLMSSIFSLPVIHGFLEVFNSQSRALLSTMDPHVGTEKLDLSSQIKKMNLETSCLTTFGKSDIKDNKLFSNYMLALDEYTKIMIHRFQKVWLHSELCFKLLGEKSKEIELVKDLKDITNEIMHKKELSSINNNNNNNETNTEADFNYTTTDVGYMPFVDRMLQQKNKDYFTDEEIRAELDTTVVAAYDTSSTFFVNLLAVIGSYPEVQEKVYEEIMYVVGPDRDVEKEDLNKLVYTEAVLKETLRFIPAAPIIARYIDKDVKLKNYILRKGSQCIIFLFGMHRHPSWGADADQFRPERWLDAATLPKKPNTFAAFSLGKRSCVGRTYAIMSAKVMLAHVVRKYRLTADHTKMQFVFDITLKSVAGHELGIQRRN